jgi:hypothetical protein
VFIKLTFHLTTMQGVARRWIRSRSSQFNDESLHLFEEIDADSVSCKIYLFTKFVFDLTIFCRMVISDFFLVVSLRYEITFSSFIAINEIKNISSYTTFFFCVPSYKCIYLRDFCFSVNRPNATINKQVMFTWSVSRRIGL